MVDARRDGLTVGCAADRFPASGADAAVRTDEPKGDATVIPTRPDDTRTMDFGGAVRAAGAVVAAVLLLVARPAFAQLGQLDEDLPRAVTIGGEGRSQIAAHVARYSDDLMSDDRTAVVSARDSITSPLADERVSVAFRQALEAAVLPQLGELVAAEDSWRRLVGLRMAADLATERTAELIEGSFDSDRPEVRYFAMFAAETLFDTVARSSAAVTDARLGRLLDRAAGVLSETRDPRLADAAVRTIASAVALPESRVSGLGVRAMESMANAAASLARRTDAVQADDVAVLPLVRAGLVLRDYTAVNSDVPRAVSMATIGFGGDLVAFVFERVQAAGNFDEASGPDLQLAGIGASLIYFGEQNRARADRENARVDNVDLVTPLRDVDLASFRTRVLGLVGEAGALRRAPFAYAENRFDR